MHGCDACGRAPCIARIDRSRASQRHAAAHPAAPAAPCPFRPPTCSPAGTSGRRYFTYVRPSSLRQLQHAGGGGWQQDSSYSSRAAARQPGLMLLPAADWSGSCGRSSRTAKIFAPLVCCCLLLGSDLVSRQRLRAAAGNGGVSPALPSPSLPPSSCEAECSQAAAAHIACVLGAACEGTVQLFRQRQVSGAAEEHSLPMHLGSAASGGGKSAHAPPLCAADCQECFDAVYARCGGCHLFDDLAGPIVKQSAEQLGCSGAPKRATAAGFIAAAAIVASHLLLQK
jgi:hypothetical protein